ncbi:hypothetical protein [Clavibacter michiganensis]|uniref:hypothetical protein n=1 Tax=Clavibacter michiganensis TaxID=28447 RepID=UPI00307A0467
MDQEPPNSKLSSAVIGTLFPGDSGQPFTNADQEQLSVSQDWQMLGALYEFAELHGVTKGLPNGYLADLLGRAGAGGEQLGLAFAARRDSEVWRHTTPEPKQEARRNIAGRAMAEASGLWALSAGHAATNVVARVVRIHKGSTRLDKDLNWTGLPVPFDHGRFANLSLNFATVKHIRRAAATTGESDLAALVEPLSLLARSPAWLALVARRDIGYHRLRPQSIEGGVPSQSPWVTDESSGTLTLSVSTFSNYVPPALEDIVDEAVAGYDALSSSMRKIRDRLPAAMRAAGVPLWNE